MVEAYNLYDISWNYSTFTEAGIHPSNSNEKYGSLTKERLNMGFN